MTGIVDHEGRVVILAPRGRDAGVIAQLLSRAGTPLAVCSDVPHCVSCLEAGAGAALVTEEAVAGPQIQHLFEWLDRQPAWSDFPFIVLATRQSARRPEAATCRLARLGNVVILERPLNAETLTSAVSSAMRARHRQYEARGLLLERERAQAALRRINDDLEQRVQQRTREVEAARDALAFTLEAAGMGHWDFDIPARVFRRSPRYDAIFGYAEPIEGWGRQLFLRHVVPDDVPNVEAGFTTALQSGRLDIECRIRRVDGTERWIAVKGNIEYDENGKPVRAAGILIDNTEWHLTENALRQAQKMEAIGQLTGGVAHDFNNLLTVIVGGLDMILRRPDHAERVKRLAEAAMNAARRGEQLTQQLLAFSRRQMLRPQTINPNRLLHSFKPLAERAAGGAVDLRFDLDPDVDPIQVDPAQFEAAVLNLIVNARDAMEAQHKARVVVRSRNIHLDPGSAADEGAPPGRYILVSVRDSGTGIPPEAMPHVFEPFFTTKEVGKGTGLGLSQVYGFARSARGFVSIHSRIGYGTTVNLYFPPSTGAVEEDEVGTPGPTPLRPALDGETILLVEDDEQVLGMAVESLEELRYSVIVARNAADALDVLRSAGRRVDILFSDVMMPGGISGPQLASEATRLRPGLKVLLTSGYVANLEEGQAIAHGELQVLNKPYRRDELARSIRLALDRAV